MENSDFNTKHSALPIISTTPGTLFAVGWDRHQLQEEFDRAQDQQKPRRRRQRHRRQHRHRLRGADAVKKRRQKNVKKCWRPGFERLRRSTGLWRPAGSSGQATNRKLNRSRNRKRGSRVWRLRRADPSFIFCLNQCLDAHLSIYQKTFFRQKFSSKKLGRFQKEILLVRLCKSVQLYSLLALVCFCQDTLAYFFINLFNVSMTQFFMIAADVPNIYFCQPEALFLQWQWQPAK